MVVQLAVSLLAGSQRIPRYLFSLLKLEQRTTHIPPLQFQPRKSSIVSPHETYLTDIRLSQVLGTEADWNIKSEPCEELENRQLHLARGKYVRTSKKPKLLDRI